MSKGITVPFARLVVCYREIGVHRDRKAGFREIFEFPTLENLPFLYLANKVKDAYEGKRVPSHEGWRAQREALRWFVEQGRDAIYGLDKIKLKPTRFRSYYIDDGYHRALALYILGEREVKAKL